MLAVAVTAETLVASEPECPTEATVMMAVRRRREDLTPNRRPYGGGRRSLYKQRVWKTRAAARERRARDTRAVAGAVVGLTSAVTERVRELQDQIDLCDCLLAELARSGVVAAAAVAQTPRRRVSGVGGAVGGKRRRPNETWAAAKSRRASERRRRKQAVDAGTVTAETARVTAAARGGALY